MTTTNLSVLGTHHPCQANTIMQVLSPLEGCREVGVAHVHAPLQTLCFVLPRHLIGASDVLPAHKPFAGPYLAQCES